MSFTGCSQNTLFWLGSGNDRCHCILHFHYWDKWSNALHIREGNKTGTPEYKQPINQANSIRNWAGITQSWSREPPSVARTTPIPYSAFIQLILPVLRFSLFPEQINATVISCGESVNKKLQSLYSKAFAALDLWGTFSASVGETAAMPVQCCRPFVCKSSW